MAPLLLIFGIFIAIWYWWATRKDTLTRACRWRLDRTKGQGHWHCLNCGASCDLPGGRTPRHCLRPKS